MKWNDECIRICINILSCIEIRLLKKLRKRTKTWQICTICFRYAQIVKSPLLKLMTLWAWQLCNCLLFTTSIDELNINWISFIISIYNAFNMFPYKLRRKKNIWKNSQKKTWPNAHKYFVNIRSIVDVFSLMVFFF